MKSLLVFIFILVSLISYSQYSSSINTNFHEIGSLQFENQINELIKLSITKNIKDFELEIDEIYYYQYDDDSLEKRIYSIKLIFSLKPDSSFYISMEQIPNEWSFIVGEHYSYKEGVYKHIGDFKTRVLTQKSEYKEISYPNRKSIIHKAKDSRSFECYEYKDTKMWLGEFNNGFHSKNRIDSTLISGFYFNKNNKLIRDFNTYYSKTKTNKYNYLKKDNIIIQSQINYDNGGYSILEQTKIISKKNKKTIILNETISSTEYNTKKETENSIAKKNNEKSITYQSLLNKDLLPIEIKIIDTKNYEYHEYYSIGSIMKIKYK